MLVIYELRKFCFGYVCDCKCCCNNIFRYICLLNCSFKTIKSPASCWLMDKFENFKVKYPFGGQEKFSKFNWIIFHSLGGSWGNAPRFSCNLLENRATYSEVILKLYFLWNLSKDGVAYTYFLLFLFFLNFDGVLEESTPCN